jgi:hypothetical protein
MQAPLPTRPAHGRPLCTEGSPAGPAVTTGRTPRSLPHLPLEAPSGSWLNLVEAFFSIISRQALRRGNFPTVADLIAAIERFITSWNDRCAPFTWTKDPAP